MGLINFHLLLAYNYANEKIITNMHMLTDSKLSLIFRSSDTEKKKMLHVFLMSDTHEWNWSIFSPSPPPLAMRRNWSTPQDQVIRYSHRINHYWCHRDSRERNTQITKDEGRIHEGLGEGRNRENRWCRSKGHDSKKVFVQACQGMVVQKGWREW